MTTPAASEGLPPELAAAKTAGLAVFGYETPGDQPSVLPCDVTARYAAGQRRPGSPRSGAADSVFSTPRPATVRRNARAGQRSVVP
jgi:hypothetical protein